VSRAEIDATGFSLTYLYGHLIAKQIVHGSAFAPEFEDSVPYKPITISTRGTGNLNLYAAGNGALVCCWEMMIR
jgi:hypothetical protein